MITINILNLLNYMFSNKFKSITGGIEMKILIAEDDLISRRYLNKVLSECGECDLVVDGKEAIDAYMMSMRDNEPYDLICLDIMMPKVDGTKVLKAIRELEDQLGIKEEDKVKIIMTTALGENQVVQKSFSYGCNAYASKPIDVVKLKDVMRKIGLEV